MKQLMNSVKNNVVEKERTAVLRLEMDYELATLFEAMNERNEEVKTKSKQKLEKIRQELIKLKALWRFSKIRLLKEKDYLTCILKYEFTYKNELQFKNRGSFINFPQRINLKRTNEWAIVNYEDNKILNQSMDEWTISKEKAESMYDKLGRDRPKRKKMD